MSARHVVLLTYGEPPSPAFGAQLIYSWRILLGLTRAVAPIPRWALPAIAFSRARFRRDLWTREGYLSPLEHLTERQARGLAAALEREAPEVAWRVHVAYEFRDPLLARVLDGLPADEPVDVVAMYAADSAFTHEISRRAVAAWGARRPARPAPVRVRAPLDPEVLAELSARHVLRELSARGVTPGPDRALVLAAHGTLLDPPRPMETGREATERLRDGIARRLGGSFGLVIGGWLNHIYGGRWTEPAADVALRQVAERGFKRVAYYPYGFLADNAETELEGRLALRTQPQLEALHLPCLNDASELMAALARDLAGSAQVDVPLEAQRAGT